MIPSGEQNLDGEPPWDAGGLQAATIDDDTTLQSIAVVSSKLSFTFAKPDPHEFVMAHTRTVFEWASLLLKIGANHPSRPIAVRAR
jgi:hypothetical protein